MKYNSHVQTVNLSSSSALRWASAPADDSSSVTQLVRNSFTRFDVLCTRFQLFLLHMTLVGDKFLELDGSRVHVINTVDDIACSFCVIQTRSHPECWIEGPSLSPQRSAAAFVELSPSSTVDPHSNCRGAELQFQAVDVN